MPVIYLVTYPQCKNKDLSLICLKSNQTVNYFDKNRFNLCDLLRFIESGPLFTDLITLFYCADFHAPITIWEFSNC